MLLQLVERTGGANVASKPEESKTEQQAQLSDDSCDKVPVRESSKGHRTTMNHKVVEVAPVEVKALPGVTQTRKTQESLDVA